MLGDAPPMTKERAEQIAKEVVARGEKRVELVKKMIENGTLGLECTEQVELERINNLDGLSAIQLSRWVLVGK